MVTLLFYFCSYSSVKDVADINFVPSTIPDECSPIHINLVVLLLDLICNSWNIIVSLDV